MAPPRTVVTTSSCSLLLIYRPRKDERLSWPSWRTYSGRFTHISGHPSAVGRAQDRESSPVKYQRFTTVPRNQLHTFENNTVGRIISNETSRMLIHVAYRGMRCRCYDDALYCTNGHLAYSYSYLLT